MRHKLLIAGLVAAVAMPSLAFAQPGCVRSNNQTTGTGAVLGALGGALIGNALGGRHSRGIDTAAGAVAGGVAGGALASGYNQPCAEGYYRPGPPPPAYGPGPGGFWAGAPVGIRERIDFLQNRVNRAASAGRIGPREAGDFNRDLDGIRHQTMDLRARDGGHLTPPDRDYLQQRLDAVSERLHWDARWGY
jgi:hypothetical protein